MCAGKAFETLCMCLVLHGSHEKGSTGIEQNGCVFEGGRTLDSSLNILPNKPVCHSRMTPNKSTPSILLYSRSTGGGGGESNI